MGIMGKLGRRLLRMALENLVETAACRAGTVIGRAVGERVADRVRPKVEVVDISDEEPAAKSAKRRSRAKLLD